MDAFTIVLAVGGIALVVVFVMKVPVMAEWLSQLLGL